MAHKTIVIDLTKDEELKLSTADIPGSSAKSLKEKIDYIKEKIADWKSPLPSIPPSIPPRDMGATSYTVFSNSTSLSGNRRDTGKAPEVETRAESYQSKVDKLELSVTNIKEEIENLKKLVSDIKNPRTTEHGNDGFSPIYPVAPPTMPQHVSPVNDLTGTEKGKGNAPNFNIVQKYDGTGNAGDHIKAYYEWLAGWRQDDMFNLKFFVTTLEGPALSWYANEEMWKRLRWEALLDNFFEECGIRSSENSSLKRKSLESDNILVAMQHKDKGKAVVDDVLVQPLPKAKKHHQTPTHTIYPQLQNYYNIPPVQYPNYAYPYYPQILFPQILNLAAQNKPSCSKKSSTDKRPPRIYTKFKQPYSQVFERLKNLGLIKPVPDSTPTNPRPVWFKEGTFCAFHSGAEGHDTEKCHMLKNKLEDMIDKGITQVRKLIAPGSETAKT